MNKNSTIHVRVNETVRANAEETLSMLGMTISDAVNMLLHQVNLVGGLPFDVKMPAPTRVIVRNSAELQQKLDEAEADFENCRALSYDEVFGTLRDKYGI